MNNKQSTTSAYQEPQNWKGTKGMWEAWNNSIGNDAGIVVAKIPDRGEEYDTSDADKALIAQAKELAKATADLIALAETLQSEVYGLSADTEYENSQPYDAWQSRIQSAKQTLIKAGLNQ